MHLYESIKNNLKSLKEEDEFTELHREIVKLKGEKYWDSIMDKSNGHIGIPGLRKILADINKKSTKKNEEPKVEEKKEEPKLSEEEKEIKDIEERLQKDDLKGQERTDLENDLRELKRGIKESESFKLNKNEDDFEDLVKRDFKLFLLDNYNDENYNNVTEDDINTYFTGMFYDIFDYDDMETANLAEDIIRREYGFEDKLTEAEEVDSNIVNELRKSSYYSKEPLVQEYIKLARQRAELAKQNLLTEELRNKFQEEINKLIDKSKLTKDDIIKPQEKKKVMTKEEYLNAHKDKIASYDDNVESVVEYFLDSNFLERDELKSLDDETLKDKIRQTMNDMWDGDDDVLNMYIQNNEEPYDKIYDHDVDVEDVLKKVKERILNESEEREYYSDAPWFENKELYDKYKDFVGSLLSDGAIDDPEYVKTLSKEEFEDLLVNTWMKDKEIQEEFEDVEGIVPCGLCDEYVYKDDCRKEMNLGWLCPNCQNSLYSRGEKAIYVENLDESDTLDKLSDDDIIKLVDSFMKAVNEKGLTASVYVGDKYQGNGGTANINDKYFIKLFITPYPKGVFISLVEKYESFILAGKTIDKYELKDFKDIDSEAIPFINNSIDNIFNNNDISNGNKEDETMNESEKQDKEVVWKYLDLPYQDFKANNTIGLLMDKTPFIVCDDNLVYLFDEPMSLADLKYKTYQTDDDYEGGYINKYFEEHCKLLDDNDSRVIPILVEIGRMPKDALDETEELELNEYKDFNHVNDVWEYLEDSKSLEDLNNRIKDIDPKKFGSIYYDLHDDNKGATVIIDYSDDNEDYYEKVDIYFDEDINESEDWEKEEPIECTIEYDEDGRPYFMYNNEKEYLDDYMRDDAGGAIKPLSAFSAIRIVPSDNGETVAVEYLHESEEADSILSQIKDNLEAIKNNEERNYEIYGSALEFPSILEKIDNVDDRRKALMMLYMNNPKLEELKTWTAKQIKDYILDTEEVFNINIDSNFDEEPTNYRKAYAKCFELIGTNLNESEEQLYIYSNAESEDKSDAESMINAQYKEEAPKLKFKMHSEGPMWFVDFIGSKKDIEDYLIKLGWYDKEELNGLIKPFNESEETGVNGMTITQYAQTLNDNYIDQDVCDTDIDMLVALVHNFNEEPTDYYDKFIKTLCDKTKVEKINNGWSEPILICKFSDVFRPYNEECKDIFDMDYSEFGEDEAYYEAVSNLEPLIAGNAGESTYKDMYDLLNGNYKIGGDDNMNESVEEHDLSKDLFGDEAANRMSQKEKDLERDLQYVRDIMAGKTVIDDKYHEELSLDTAKAWLRKDFVYVNGLSTYSPEEVNKRLADEYPDIFSINESNKKVPKIKVITDIEWETDGDEEALEDLPKTVDMPDDINADEAADYLSDEYGWLVNSLDVRWVTEDEYKKLTEAETYINKKELTDDEILQAAKYVLNNNKDLSKVFGWNNFVENAVWNYLKDKKGLKKFPSNLYKRIRNVIYNSPEFEKFNEAEEKPATKIPEPIMVYMNTWKNYNEYGADLDAYGIKDGWMTIDDALEFCKKYAEDEPFINDIDNNTNINLEVSEYDNAPSVLEGLKELNDALYFGVNGLDLDDVALVYEAWSDKESVSTPSLEKIEEFIDYLNNGEYYVHDDITSTYDIGKYYVDNVGYEGVSDIEYYIDSDQVKEDWQDEINNDYEEDSEDWYEVDDSMVEEDIEQAVQANNTDFFDKYFDYESLGDDIYDDGYWYVTDNGSVEIY